MDQKDPSAGNDEAGRRHTCEVCGGSGQAGHFLGVSRFLLTWEECPACAGLGFTIPSPEDGRQDQKR